MATTTFNPTKDCTIDLALPTTSDNTTSLTISQNIGGTAKKRTLLYFDLSSLVGPLESIVTADLVMVNTGGSYPGTANFNFYRVTTTSWTEAATWNTIDGGNAWTTPGGDYTTALGLSFSTSGAPANFDLTNVQGLDLLVSDAISNRSGILSIICLVDAGNTWIGKSRETGAATGPILTLTYLQCPIIERIARLFKTRLDLVVAGGTYRNTFTVVRPLPSVTVDWSHGKVLIEQSPAARLTQVLEGNPPLNEYEQDFVITICIAPSEASTSPIDAECNFAAADAKLAIASSATWAQWNSLAEWTEHTGTDIANDGELKLVKLTYTVTYRTADNDPYTAR
jgi:hypothetical protein